MSIFIKEFHFYRGILVSSNKVLNSLRQSFLSIREGILDLKGFQDISIKRLFES